MFAQVEACVVGAFELVGAGVFDVFDVAVGGLGVVEFWVYAACDEVHGEEGVGGFDPLGFYFSFPFVSCHGFVPFVEKLLAY